MHEEIPEAPAEFDENLALRTIFVEIVSEAPPPTRTPDGPSEPEIPENGIPNTDNDTDTDSGHAIGTWVSLALSNFVGFYLILV